MRKVITNRDDGTRRVQLFFDDEEDLSRVEQSHRDECNINSIMKRYMKTGMLSRNPADATYGDFSDMVSFQEAQNRVISAERDFMSLSSAIRKKFQNDPGKLIDFLGNPENRQEAIELGLVVDRPKVESKSIVGETETRGEEIGAPTGDSGGG